MGFTLYDGVVLGFDAVLLILTMYNLIVQWGGEISTLYIILKF